MFDDYYWVFYFRLFGLYRVVVVSVWLYGVVFWGIVRFRLLFRGLRKYRFYECNEILLEVF